MRQVWPVSQKHTIEMRGVGLGWGGDFCELERLLL